MIETKHKEEDFGALMNLHHLNAYATQKSFILSTWSFSNRFIH